MNKLYFTLPLLFCLIIFPKFFFAQTEKHYNRKAYKAKVHCAGDVKIKCVLYSVMDSAVILMSGNSKKGTQSFDTIPYNKIKNIFFIRKGSGGIGFAIGAGASIAAGIVVAYAEDDPSTQFTDGLFDVFTGILLAPIVGGVGAIIGSHTGKNFEINYDYIQFQKVKDQLNNRALLLN